MLTVRACLCRNVRATLDTNMHAHAGCHRPGGRLVLIGNVTNAAAKLPLGLMIINSLEVSAGDNGRYACGFTHGIAEYRVQVIGSDSITASELADCFEFMSIKGIRPEVSQVLPLERVADAHEMLQTQSVTGRIVLDVGGDWGQ